MKKITLLHIFIIMVTGVHAQYTPFPTSNAIWRAEEAKGVLLRASDYPNINASFDTRFYFQKEDTLIDNLTYKKITEKVLISSASSDSAYYGAMREDVEAKKVYFKGKNWTKELLLFNFNLKVGDIIKGWYSLDSLPDSTYFVVKNIKKVKYTPSSLIERNLYELEAYKLPAWAYTFPSICLLYEGIGFSTGLFKSPIRNTKYNRQFRQSCFYDGVVEVRSCESLTGIADKNNNLVNFALYPNPTNATLSIHPTLQIDRLVVYQSNGTKVLESKGMDNLDVSILPEGLYLLVAWDVEGRRIVKKFEKR